MGPLEVLLNHAVECGYKAIQYNIILYTTLQRLRQNLIRLKVPKDTPYLTLMGELWGVFCEDLEENWLCYNGTPLHFFSTIQSSNKCCPQHKPWINLGENRHPCWQELLALCEGNPPVTGGFPSQRASNAEHWSFLYHYHQQTAEHSVELLVIWDTI